MQNKEIIITREQAESLIDSLRDCLNNEGVYQIKINITDGAIMLTAHVQSMEIKLCSN